MEQTHQPAGTTQHAAHQTQPLAGAEDDDDERDWECLDERAVIGEGCYDEERKTAERCHDATLSEGEERAFRDRVAAVVRKNPKAKRIAVIPHPRFRKQPAGGGGTEPAWSATIRNRKDLHNDALSVAVKFSMDTLRQKDDKGGRGHYQIYNE